MWLRRGGTTIAVDMAHSDVYVLPRHAGDVPDEPPRRTAWRTIGSMPEGSKVLVSGRLSPEGGHAILRGDADEPVLAVFYDGPEGNLLRRCIWSGRQLNEYWNQLTPGALAGGTLALIIVAYVLMRSPVGRSLAVISLSIASVPLLPLLPPGVLLFFLYRRTWRKGRVYRAHRDVLRLPLRHLASGEVNGSLPDGQEYCLRYVDAETAKGLQADGAVGLAPPIPESAGEFAVFAHPGLDGLKPPPDPLSELIIVPGNPDLLANECQRRARRYELLSSFVLGAGLLANLFLVFSGLQLVLR